MTYSETVIFHFDKRYGLRTMGHPDGVGLAGRPGFGNYAVVYLRIADGVIGEASFQTHGCCPSIAAGSLLISAIEGSTVDAAAEWTEERLESALGGLPPHKRHCSALMIAALKNALANVTT